MRFLIIVIVSGLLTTSHVGLCQHVDADKKAKEYFNAGNAHFGNKDFSRAAREFRKAYEMKPTWKLWFNIGQSEAANGKYGLALEAFESYLAEGKDNVREDRFQTVLKEIDRLRRLVGVLDVAAPEGTELLVDGTLRGVKPFAGVVRVAVGRHRVILKYGTQVLLDKQVMIAGSIVTEIEGNTPIDTAVSDDSHDAHIAQTSDDELEPEPALSPVPDAETSGSTEEPQADNAGKPGKKLLVGSVVSFVGAAAALGSAGFFTAKRIRDIEAREDAVSDYNESLHRDAAARKEAMEADENMKSAAIAMAVTFSVAGVLSAAGTLLLVLHKKEQRNESISLAPSIDGIAISF